MNFEESYFNFIDLDFAIVAVRQRSRKPLKRCLQTDEHNTKKNWTVCEENIYTDNIDSRLIQIST